ncbi:Nif3-like dinuclear metal center hexameric protein [Paenibacillus sp. HB172176]|uniref:Nif3-like dinuclear metal center hexameric protein n=1 Tax=Paenibacillus sp. HB172176 TaxID=2493690 RepID=UPI00143A318D|nr:Nif3-like dinuclear metal center hexameric protein [Paenibacillus sp. HB172176]
MGITIQEVIKTLTMPGGNSPDTVDELLAGEPGSEVTGIVTAFMPTLSIVEQAAALGTNLVVAHEMLYYAHRDGDKLHAGSNVRQEKGMRIDASGVAIYRCHDYCHRLQPDMITEGLVRELDWLPYVHKRLPHAVIVQIPPATLKEAAEHIKARLGVAFLRAMGDPSTLCRRIGVLAGFRGQAQFIIPMFEEEQLDLVLYGEGFEWETPEYVRDSLYLGEKRALLALGHAESEEAGMSALADHLRLQFPGIPVHFIKEKPLFTVM